MMTNDNPPPEQVKGHTPGMEACPRCADLTKQVSRLLTRVHKLERDSHPSVDIETVVKEVLEEYGLTPAAAISRTGAA